MSHATVSTLIDILHLDANHFAIALIILAISLWTTISNANSNRGSSLRKNLAWVQYFLVGLVVICGVLMLVRNAWIERLSRIAYTGFDTALTLLAAISIVMIFLRLVAPGAGSELGRAFDQEALEKSE